MNVQRILVPGALALALAAPAAQAQSAGTWLVKVGVNRIAPQVDSGPLSAPSLPDTRIDVKAATSLIATATYFYTSNISVEAFAGLPYKHDIVGDGSIAGAGKLGTTKQVSPTVFGQWRFGEGNAAVRPYVGAGLTYAKFYGEEGSNLLTATTNPGGTPTRMSIDPAWGLSMQVGLSWKIDDRWSIDAAVIKTKLKTTTTLSTGQTIATRLDPMSTGVSAAYRF